MSSFNSLLMVGFFFGLLISYSAVSGQPLLLTGPLMVRKSPSQQVIYREKLGIQKPLVSPDNINGKTVPGFGLTRVRVNPIQIPISGYQLHVYHKTRIWKTIESFCFDTATERMKSLRINSQNKQIEKY